MRRIATAGALILALSQGGTAEARPEVTSDLAVQYGRRTGAAPEGLFGLDLHAALLGDRESGSGFAAGGTVHVGAFDFAELHAGVGGALLLPGADGWPLVLEAWPFVVADAQGVRAGAAARLFFGARGFPRLGAYVLSVGLFVESRYVAAGGGHPDAVDLHAGIDIDAFALLWPWMFLWEALFG